MSGIAEVLLASNFEVSGSDVVDSPIVERLRSLGARVFIGHDSSHVQEASCVVVSSAISRTNPELREAERLGIPVIPRAEMLAELMRLKKGVAVAGSHGKTTSTSILGQILKPLRPTVVVGGVLQNWNASSIVGKGSTFVIEADESDRSFLRFSPVYTLITNIDSEHFDTYKDLDDIKASFLEFLNKTAFFGENWINEDCQALKSLKPKIRKPTKSFGQTDEADLKIQSVELGPRGSRFCLGYQGNDLGEFELPVAGMHNVLNACGAIGVSLSLGLGMSGVKKRLREFVPADRRLQVHRDDKDYAVVEDYAHHPTEMRAALSAVEVMFPGWKKVVVFQPHRFSRTELLWEDFIHVLQEFADRLFLLPIYAAHERPISGVSSERMAEELGEARAKSYSDKPRVGELVRDLKLEREPNTVFVFLGAAPLTDYAQAATQLDEKILSL